MNLKQIQNDLFNQELNRKQFLQVVGAALLGLLGVTAFLQNLVK